MSKKVLSYKGYIAKVEFSIEDKCLHGKIEGISDLVTFESDSAIEIEQEFRSAVDDYLAFCAEVGKEPNKSYSGTFNIRIDPSIHKSLDYYAIEHDTTLNSVVSEACGAFVKTDSMKAAKEWSIASEKTPLVPEGWDTCTLSPLQSAA